MNTSERASLSRICGLKNKERWTRLKERAVSEWTPPFENPFFCLGLGLYWGEGDKTDGVGMSNCDPGVLRTFISWCNTFFQASRFSVLVQHYHPENDDAVKSWWSQELNIPLRHFTRSVYSISKASTGKRPDRIYGTAKVRMRDKQLWITTVRIAASLTALSSRSLGQCPFKAST